MTKRLGNSSVSNKPLEINRESFYHPILSLFNPDFFELDSVFIIKTEENCWRLIVKSCERVVTDLTFHTLAMAKRIFAAKHLINKCTAGTPLWNRLRDEHILELAWVLKMPKPSIIEQLRQFINANGIPGNKSMDVSFLEMMSALVRVSYTNGITIWTKATSGQVHLDSKVTLQEVA